MIVCRPYIQTVLFNLVVGIGMPAGCLLVWTQVLPDPAAAHKMDDLFLSALPGLAGLYFLIFHCVWGLRCDQAEKTITFFKTMRQKTFPIQQMKQLTVFKTLRGFDYRFTIGPYSVTLEEMDNMPELVAFLKKANPQLDINSPEDHKYF